MYDAKKKAFVEKLEELVVDSLDAKHLMTSLKRVAGEKYLEIPVIMKGDGSAESKLPTTASESLNNLADEYSKVGFNSKRKNEYSAKFYQTRERTISDINDIYRNFRKLEAEADLNFRVERKQVQDIIESLGDTASGPDEIPPLFLKKTLGAP